MDDLTNDLENVKDQYRILEKKDRESAQNIRELKDEVDKLKYKQNQSELLKS